MDGVAGVLVVLVQEVDGGGDEEREYCESATHPKHACGARSLLLQLIWSKLNISQSLCQVPMSQRIELKPAPNWKCLFQTFLAAVVLSKIYWLLNEEQEEKEVLLFASF